MLSFSEDYFREEYRDGFLVSEMMKRSWASQLTILDELKKLFDKYDLRYFAEVGTLLGAVRHKGYVPWDDDLDIGMPRKDYMLLLEHADEIREGLCIRSIYNSDVFSSFHAVATHKADILKWDEERMRNYQGCPFICFVDIFPWDDVPEDSELFKKHKALYSYAYKLLYDCMDIENKQNQGELITFLELEKREDTKSRELLDGIERLRALCKKSIGVILKIDRKKKLRNQLSRITDKIAQMYEGSSGIVDYSPNLAICEINSPRKKIWSEILVDLPFEFGTIKAPKHSREVLFNQYGASYMTPIRGGAAHDYPFFRTEIQVLINGDTGDNYFQSPVKRNLLQMLETLLDAHKEICEISDNETRLSLLAQLQETAEIIGNTVENVVGAGTKSVAGLEKYCELVYLVYTKLDSGDGGNLNITDDMTALTGQILSVRKDIISEVIPKINDSWKNRLFDDNRQKRKTVLCALSATDIVNNGSLSVPRIRTLLGEYRQKVYDTCLILLMPSGLEEFMRRCGLSFIDEYQSLVKELLEADWLIFSNEPTSDDMEVATSLCDTYYGDQCLLSEACKGYGKDVTIWQYQE